MDDSERRTSGMAVKEIIPQQAVYCGVPAGNHAFKLASEILAESGT